MARVLSVFNHKGGVGKTTTVFHVSWLLAEMGLKVLMIDSDSQCNLTGLVLGLNEFDDFYKQYPERNLMHAVKPAFNAMPKPIAAIDSVKVDQREGLFLIPGHLDISLYEISLGMAHDLSNSINTFLNLPGAFNEFISKQIEKDDIDVVIIDLNPSLSSINQNLFCLSDAFLIPAAPDYFSRMAIRTLSITIPKWVRWSTNAVEVFRDSEYIWPKRTPKFFGTIVQNFSKRNNAPTVAFQRLIDDFNNDVDSIFAPKMKTLNMVLNNDYIHGLVPNFQGMITRMVESGNPAVPVFYADTLAQGIVDQNYSTNKEYYKKSYQDICDGIARELELL